MSVMTDVVDQRLIAHVTGDLDAHTSPGVTDAILDAMRSGEIQRVIISLRSVEFMSSPGLRMLLTVYKQGEAGGVPVVVAEPQPNVLRVIETAGFSKMMDIFNTLDAAKNEDT